MNMRTCQYYLSPVSGPHVAADPGLVQHVKIASTKAPAETCDTEKSVSGNVGIPLFVLFGVSLVIFSVFFLAVMTPLGVFRMNFVFHIESFDVIPVLAFAG